VLNVVTLLLVGVGTFFFVAGTIGLLRFPDTLTRLHALTKADNLGLGFVVAGLALQQGSLLAAAKLILIWLLALLGSSSACYLLGYHSLKRTSRDEVPE
jgi:multicomponent Na+:H+ antiporter subunit G